MYLDKNGSYGVLSEDGEWDGMMKSLIDGDADVAVADIVSSHERALVTDLSIPLIKGK